MRPVHQLQAAGFGISPDFEETMDIHTAPGVQVIFRGRGGYEYDKKSAERSGLLRDHFYTVDRIQIDRSSSLVVLKEFPGQFFNTCLFCNAVETR